MVLVKIRIPGCRWSQVAGAGPVGETRVGPSGRTEMPSHGDNSHNPSNGSPCLEPDSECSFLFRFQLLLREVQESRSGEAGARSEDFRVLRGFDKSAHAIGRSLANQNPVFGEHIRSFLD